MQRLADEGVVFRRAFAAAPTCSPSRAALVTGQSPHRCGMLGLSHRGFRLHDPGRHWVHALRAAGYATARVGVQHVSDDPDAIAHDRVLSPGPWSTPAIAAAAARYLHDHARRDDPAPLYLDVGFPDTHRGFGEIGPDDDPRHVAVPPPLPDTPAVREDIAAFHTALRRLDAGIDTVLDALDAAGLAGQTLVICTTDHGAPFPGFKCTLTDRGLGVLLLMRGPADSGFHGGRVIDAMVSHLDLYPTVADLAGLEPPGDAEGRSMLPLVRGEVESLHEALFGEVTYHAAYEPMRSVRTERYKYIRRFGDRLRPAPANAAPCPSRRAWEAAGWLDQPLPREALYDLVLDPGEGANLAADPSRQAVLAAMRNRLEAWMHRTADPLVDGEAPLPPGAVANRPEDDKAGIEPALKGPLPPTEHAT